MELRCQLLCHTALMFMLIIILLTFLRRPPWAKLSRDLTGGKFHIRYGGARNESMAWSTLMK